MAMRCSTLGAWQGLGAGPANKLSSEIVPSTRRSVCPCLFQVFAKHTADGRFGHSTIYRQGGTNQRDGHAHVITLASSSLAWCTLSFSSGRRSRKRAYNSVTGRAIRTYSKQHIMQGVGGGCAARVCSVMYSGTHALSNFMPQISCFHDRAMAARASRSSYDRAMKGSVAVFYVTQRCII